MSYTQRAYRESANEEFESAGIGVAAAARNVAGRIILRLILTAQNFI
jgi:hypothetical protein